MEKTRRRKTIGLLVGGVSDNYSISVIRGMQEVIKDKDVNIVILPGKYIFRDKDSGQRYQWEYQYNALFSLPNADNIDGLIIAASSICSLTTRKNMEKFLGLYSGIPMVLIEEELEGYASVRVDDESGLRAGLEYLIEQENCNRVCMIGGDDDNTVALARKKIYLKVLEENGIPFEERYFAAGNLSENDTQVFEKILDDNPDMQAIFCVNDDSALGFYRTMRERGLVPGEDIRILGFDNTLNGRDARPQLATVGYDMVEFCERTLELLDEQIKGEKPRAVTVPTQFIRRGSALGRRESFGYMDSREFERLYEDIFYDHEVEDEEINWEACFCEIMNRITETLDTRYISDEDYDKLCALLDRFFERGVLQYTNPVYFLDYLRHLKRHINKSCDGFRHRVRMQELCDYIDEKMIIYLAEERVNDHIQRKAELDSNKRFVDQSMRFKHGWDRELLTVFRNINLYGIRECIVYLFEDRMLNLINEKFTYPETVKKKLIYHNGRTRIIPEEKQPVKTAEVFDGINAYTVNKIFMVLPLYFEEYIYGYFLCDVNERLFTEADFIASQYSMAVRLLHLIRENEEIVRRMEDDLYKKGRFEPGQEFDENGNICSEEIFETVLRKMEKGEERDDLIVGLISVNHMKIINTRYGREEGDYVLDTVGKLLKDFVGREGAVYHRDWDEFRIAFRSDRSLITIKNQLRERLLEINETNGKPYNILLAIGFGRIPYGVERDLDDAYAIAQDEHYSEKNEKDIYVIKQQND